MLVRDTEIAEGDLFLPIVACRWAKKDKTLCALCDSSEAGGEHLMVFEKVEFLELCDSLFNISLYLIPAGLELVKEALDNVFK